MALTSLGALSALFGRGYARLGVALGIINILTFAKVWEDLFKSLGIPIVAVIISIPLLFVTICVIVGYLEKSRGIWGTELRYTWYIAGYDPIKMVEDVKEIKTCLQSMKEQHGERQG